MSAAKHTPGPWTISKYRQPNGWEILGPIEQPVAIEPWHGGPEHKQWEEIYEANALLIAAAPELLAHMEISIDKDNDWGPVEWEAWNTKAKQLIAKATQPTTEPAIETEI